jgi:hypothetical protein
VEETKMVAADSVRIAALMRMAVVNFVLGKMCSMVKPPLVGEA